MFIVLDFGIGYGQFGTGLVLALIVFEFGLRTPVLGNFAHTFLSHLFICCWLLELFYYYK